MARIKAVVALLLLSLSSCAPATRHLSRAATQGAVEGVADAVAKHPEAQRKIADNLDEGAIRVGVERSSAGVIDGALDSLEEPARRERINKEVAAITASLVSTLVSSAGNAALSDANQQKVAAMTAGLVRLLKSELLPDQETVAKMMPVVRELVKNMTLGFQDAIDETQAKRNAGELPAGQGSVLWAAGEAAESSNEVLYMLGAGAVVLALAGIVVGVWAFRSAKANKAELACLAVNPDYRREGYGERLMKAVEKAAKDQGINTLFVLTTRTAAWFLERGFRAATIADLPEKKQALYNFERASQVYVKQI